MASETTISEWVNDIHEGDSAEVMARGPAAQQQVWRVLENQGDATIQEVVDATGLSYQTAGRYLRLFEAVCPSISKRPFLEDAWITVFDLESRRGEQPDD